MHKSNSFLSLLHLMSCSFVLIACSYFLVFEILSRIQAPSPRHRCRSVIIPSPPAPSYFLAVPRLELESRHPPRNGDLCGHQDDWSRRSFTTPILAMDPPSIPRPHYAGGQLVNEIAALYPRGAQSFPPLYKVAILVLRSSKTHVPDERSVGACAPLR